MRDAVSDCSDIQTRLEKLYEEAAVVTELTRQAVERNAQESLNQEEYLRQYHSYVDRYEKLKEQIDKLEIEKKRRKEKGILIGGFMFEVSEHETFVSEFDEQLWMLVIDIVEIQPDGNMVFKFRNGMEIIA